MRFRSICRRRPLALIPAVALLLLVLSPSLRIPLAASAALAGCSSSRTDLSPDTEESAMLRRINDYRAQSGLGPLTLSRTLMSTAAWKSNDLGTNGYFDHNDLFRSWSQRFQDCGYAFPGIEENLAAGYSDAASTFEQWRTTYGHNVNMLNGSMKAVGIARASVPGSPYGWYWTASFGAVIDSAQPTIPLVANSAPPAGSSTLATGSTARVSGAGTNDCLRVHANPSTSAPVVACLVDGTSMVISDGPITADGYTWWRLGTLGWSASAYLVSSAP